MDRQSGHGPDDMGDDPQETEVAGYEQYIEDPPDDLVIAEDDDNDAEQATDWAARHPRATSDSAGPGDKPAEESAIHETRGELPARLEPCQEVQSKVLRAANLLASNRHGSSVRRAHGRHA